MACNLELDIKVSLLDIIPFNYEQKFWGMKILLKEININIFNICTMALSLRIISYFCRYDLLLNINEMFTFMLDLLDCWKDNAALGVQVSQALDIHSSVWCFS